MSDSLDPESAASAKMEGRLLRQRREWLQDDSKILPLQQMSIEERLVADYAGTGLTTDKRPHGCLYACR